VKSRIIAAAAFVLAALTAAITPAHATQTIALNNGNGLSVTTSYWVDPNLLDITVASALLPGQAGIRVLLPANYQANPTARYPVLYLLHGGGGLYTDWTTFGDVEQVAAGLPVIIVMPTSGKGGWYSDFDNFGAGGPPEWESFAINQVLPWVDANFRTTGTRAGRAIAGLSMGGYGAMSYAARHPDLFVSASSFSGADDTALPGFDAYVEVSPVIDGEAPGAIWGVPPFDMPGLLAHNPTTLASNMGGMHIGMYTGNGNQGPLDGSFAITGVFDNIQEAVVEQMNIQFDQALTQAGITHTLDDYGNGTHSWPYWNRDFSQEMPAIMATFANPPAAANIVADTGFESAGMGPWACTGQCGVDQGRGNAYAGANNGWVRNDSGWNDINQTVTVAANTNYHLTGWLRTSANSNNGFFGVRTTGGTVINQKQFTSINGYSQLSVDLNTGNNTSVVVFGGVWTNSGDIWLQIDNVALAPGS